MVVSMVEAKDLFDAVAGIAAGVSGVLAAGASVTTILGTSTVIAGGIDGVTGASALTSALAMLGGGAVAVGGAGMIGGIAVIATAAAVPAVIVGLQVWQFFHH